MTPYPEAAVEVAIPAESDEIAMHKSLLSTHDRIGVLFAINAMPGQPVMTQWGAFECLRTKGREPRPEVSRSLLDTQLPFTASQGFPTAADTTTT